MPCNSNHYVVLEYVFQQDLDPVLRRRKRSSTPWLELPAIKVLPHVFATKALAMKTVKQRQGQTRVKYFRRSIKRRTGIRMEWVVQKIEVDLKKIVADTVSLWLP